MSWKALTHDIDASSRWMARSNEPAGDSIDRLITWLMAKGEDPEELIMALYSRVGRLPTWVLESEESRARVNRFFIRLWIEEHATRMNGEKNE